MKNKKVITRSENGISLEENIRGCFKNKVPSESDIQSLANALRVIPNYAVTDEELNEIILRLHESLTIYMGLGNCVDDNSSPWLWERKAEINPFYWSRYESDLLRQGWPSPVVRSLDKVTDEILDRIGNPTNESEWSKRG